MIDSCVIAIDEKRRAKTSATIRELQGQLPVIIATQQILAEVTRAKYDALLTQGFTASQALDLCK